MSAKSCSELKDRYNFLQSGIYKINPDGNNEFEVYCDMITDGGGFTLLSNIEYEDDVSIEIWNYEKNKQSPSTSLSYSLGAKNIQNLLDEDTIIKFECQDRFTLEREEIYHKNISDFQSYFTFEDSYLGSVECSSNLNFINDYSNSLNDCIYVIDEYHRYYTYKGGGSGFALYNFQTPKSLRHCGDNWHGDGDAGTMNHRGKVWIR